MTTQPLSNIVNVTVSVSPAAAVNSGFNLGLIIGNSTIISDSQRVEVFNSTDDMLAAGWTGNEPEYAAAQIYFSQSPRPNQVAIGRWDTTASETAVQAVTACRNANSDWYACYVVGAQKADILAVSQYIETATPLSVYFYRTQDVDVLAGTAGNVMQTLQAAARHRTFGQYSSVNHAAVAAMGYAMGANTGLTNSAFTLAYKPEVGITVEALTTTQSQTVSGYNGNAYLSYGLTYNLLTPGVMADGTHFDEVLNLDVLTNNIQTAVLTALMTGTKVPQTDAGVTLLLNAITVPCEQARQEGVLAPGVWNGPTLLGLSTGDTLSPGYMVLADTVDNQSQADRAARKSPPIYVAVKMAGAIEHAAINVQVNQ